MLSILFGPHRTLIKVIYFFLEKKTNIHIRIVPVIMRWEGHWNPFFLKFIFFNTQIILCWGSVLVQSLSRVWLFVTPWTAARQASLSITNSWSLPKPMSIELVMPSSHLTFVVPFPSCPQSFPASGSFKWVSSLHQVAKVLEFEPQHQAFQWTPRTDLL